MPSAAATSRASATRRSLLPAPRPSTGPAPSLTSPASSLASAAGVSLQKSPSSTISTSGAGAAASALAPMKVVSSCTVEKPVRRAAPGAAAYSSSARIMAYTPARSSSACVATTPGDSSMKSGVKVTGSPTATRASAASRSAAPMSRNCSWSSGALSRSSAGMM